MEESIRDNGFVPLEKLLTSFPQPGICGSKVFQLRKCLKQLDDVQTRLIQRQHELQEKVSALQLDRQSYEQLFESAPVASAVTNRHGVIEEANYNLRELVSTKRQSLAGRPLALYVHMDDHLQFYRLLNSSDDMAGTVSLRMLTEDKDHFCVGASFRRLQDGAIHWSFKVEGSTEAQIS